MIANSILTPMTSNDLANLLARLDGNYGDDGANQAEAADVIRELMAEVERLRGLMRDVQ